MPIEAILFDADGVVIFPWRFARYLEQQHGITPPMTRDFFRGVFEECLIGKADLKQILPRSILRRVHLAAVSALALVFGVGSGVGAVLGSGQKKKTKAYDLKEQ